MRSFNIFRSSMPVGMTLRTNNIYSRMNFSVNKNNETVNKNNETVNTNNETVNTNNETKKKNTNDTDDGSDIILEPIHGTWNPMNGIIDSRKIEDNGVPLKFDLLAPNTWVDSEVGLRNRVDDGWDSDGGDGDGGGGD